LEKLPNYMKGFLPSLKYFHKVNNGDVPANEGLAINKQIRIKNIFLMFPSF